jgi:hypothetical protein
MTSFRFVVAMSRMPSQALICSARAEEMSPAIREDPKESFSISCRTFPASKAEEALESMPVLTDPRRGP